MYTLVRPLLPPPGHSYMEKTYMTVNKNISFSLGSNSKTKSTLICWYTEDEYEYHFQPNFFKWPFPGGMLKSV